MRFSESVRGERDAGSTSVRGAFTAAYRSRVEAAGASGETAGGFGDPPRGAATCVAAPRCRLLGAASGTPRELLRQWASCVPPISRGLAPAIAVNPWLRRPRSDALLVGLVVCERGARTAVQLYVTLSTEVCRPD